MGSQMAVCMRNVYKDPLTQDLAQDPVSQDLPLLDLPNEVLVKIISFLPEARDKVKLRYVSQKIRNVSETPSLWRDFVWPDCNPREAECLHNVMKVCGIHIRRLSFPQHIIQPVTLPTPSRTARRLVEMSEMTKILQYCTNLTHLDLPAVTSSSGELDKQLKAIEEMKHLKVLSIYCNGSFQPYLNLKVALKELTVHTVIQSRKDVEAFENWTINEFTPPNLNVVILNGSTYSIMARFMELLMHAWQRWNSQIPAGRTACLRLYIRYKAPLNLFQNMPVLQLRYGEAVTLPFVQASSVGVTGKWLLLTDRDGDGSKMTTHMAKVYPQPPYTIYRIIRNQGRDCDVSDLSYLTELDLSSSNLDIKQIAIVCPQLQRLSLYNNKSLKLEDLQVIATSCHSLQGLNLMDILVTDIQICLKMWEILSSMKLTHLSMDVSFVCSNLAIDDAQKKQLVALFRQCTTLQALELHSDHIANLSTANTNYALLSHFPSLEYCRSNDSQQSTCVQDILTACKRLKCFYCSCSVLTVSSVCNSNLQQLCISSKGTYLDNSFMETVSAHGGLVHVALFVHSVTINGITCLIKNSPNLLTFGLHEQKRHKEKYFESISASLGRKFADRKLFTSGLLCLTPQAGDAAEYNEYDEWLQNTDLMSLWPPDQFRDLSILELYS